MSKSRKYDPDSYEKQATIEHGTFFQKQEKKKKLPNDCIFRESGGYVVIAGIKKNQHNCINKTEHEERKKKHEKHCKKISIEYKPSESVFCNEIVMRLCKHRKTMKVINGQ